VRLLILAGVNDDPDLIRRTGEWLAAIEPTMRLKLIGFRAHGARPHDPPLIEPTRDSLDQIAAILGTTSEFELAVV
jgi:pyruvate-formate lyase-activating enzyme